MPAKLLPQPSNVRLLDLSMGIFISCRRTIGELGSLSPGQSQRDQWQQEARLLGEGNSVVIAVVRMGVPVSE